MHVDMEVRQSISHDYVKENLVFTVGLHNNNMQPARFSHLRSLKILPLPL